MSSGRQRQATPDSPAATPPSGAGTPAGRVAFSGNRPRQEVTPTAASNLPLVQSSGPREIGLGAVIDRRYCLRRLIAHGGGGIVYEAEQLVSGRRVALKVVVPGDAAWNEKRLRLLREARAMVLVQQPNVVEVLDAGSDDSGIPYLAMELLEGRGLDGIIASRTRLTPPETVGLGLELCRTLGHAHRRGVLHRDVKPSNVFVSRNGLGEERVKLIDFGIAAFRDEGPDEIKITRVGAIVGTPEYLAPEQLLGRSDCDHRADIYSLGVLLYECLTGGVPFEGSLGQIVLRVSTEEVPSLRARCPEASEALASVVHTALARDPAARFPDMGAMTNALTGLAAPGSRPLILPGTRPLEVAAPPERVTAVDIPAPVESRRRFPRAPYVTPVRLIEPDGTLVDGRTEDISEGGMLALMPRRCDSDQLVQVRFALPVTGRIVTARAHSRWVRVARAGAAAGLEFVDFPAEYRAAIREYVALMRGE